MDADPRMDPEAVDALRDALASVSDRAALIGLAIAVRTLAQVIADRADEPHRAAGMLRADALAVAAMAAPARCDAALLDEVRKVILATLAASPAPRRQDFR